MWVARDKSGELYLYVIKPCRSSWGEDWQVPNKPTEYYRYEVAVLLSDQLFPEFQNITWEDEPLEVNLVGTQELITLKDRACQAPTKPYLGY